MTYDYQYIQRLSLAITWLRFPLIFFIILLHCYSVVRIEGTGSLYFSTLYPFSLWIGETGVPAFFFISGYLFFLSSKSYKQKIETRIHTLLIPYLLWNAILLALYLVTYAAGYPQSINHRSITEYGFTDYVRLFWDRGSYDNGNFVPLLCPFWYIRNLLLMSILSPIFYYIIKYLRELFLITIAVWWVFTFDNAFIPQTILFFCLGAYFPIHHINPLALCDKNRILFLSFFVAFSVSDIGMHTIWSSPISLQIHRLALIFNIPTLLLVADWCTRKGFSNKQLPNAAFIVFAIHYPIVTALRKACATVVNATDGIHILLYFLCVATTAASSLLIYSMMAKYTPNAKNILSGNR